jgi:hypothetical protein
VESIQTQNLEQQSSKLEESQKTHQAELALLQKQHKIMKVPEFFHEPTPP